MRDIGNDDRQEGQCRVADAYPQTPFHQPMRLENFVWIQRFGNGAMPPIPTLMPGVPRNYKQP